VSRVLFVAGQTVITAVLQYSFVKGSDLGMRSRGRLTRRQKKFNRGEHAPNLHDQWESSRINCDDGD